MITINTKGRNFKIKLDEGEVVNFYFPHLEEKILTDFEEEVHKKMNDSDDSEKYSSSLMHHTLRTAIDSWEGFLDNNGNDLEFNEANQIAVYEYLVLQENKLEEILIAYNGVSEKK